MSFSERALTFVTFVFAIALATFSAKACLAALAYAVATASPASVLIGFGLAPVFCLTPVFYPHFFFYSYSMFHLTSSSTKSHILFCRDVSSKPILS